MAPDYKFYDHFKEILDRKINKYGIKQMKKDLIGKLFYVCQIQIKNMYIWFKSLIILKILNLLSDLEEINKEITEKCNFTLSDNKDLPAQNKQWGFAQMVGFQVIID